MISKAKYTDLENDLKEFIDIYIQDLKLQERKFVSRDMIVHEFLNRPGENENRNPDMRTLRVKVTYIIKTYYSFPLWNSTGTYLQKQSGNHWTWIL